MSLCNPFRLYAISAVYNQRSGELKKGETPESYFIQIQAAYELLMDRDQRRQYDIDHRTNPLKVNSVHHTWGFFVLDWTLRYESV